MKRVRQLLKMVRNLEWELLVVILVTLAVLAATLALFVVDPEGEDRRDLRLTILCDAQLNRLAMHAVDHLRTGAWHELPDHQVLRKMALDPGILVCPISREPYRIESGLRWDMPGTLVYISCPYRLTGGFHRIAGGERALLVTVSLQVVHVDRSTALEDIDLEGQTESVAAMKRAVRDRNVEFVARALRGSWPQGRSLAAWGLGELGEKKYADSLRTWAADLQEVDWHHIAARLQVANALLKLDDRRGVGLMKRELLRRRGPGFHHAHLRRRWMHARLSDFLDRKLPLDITTPPQEQRRAIEGWDP